MRLLPELLLLRALKLRLLVAQGAHLPLVLAPTESRETALEVLVPVEPLVAGSEQAELRRSLVYMSYHDRIEYFETGVGIPGFLGLTWTESGLVDPEGKGRVIHDVVNCLPLAVQPTWEGSGKCW